MGTVVITVEEESRAVSRGAGGPFISCSWVSWAGGAGARRTVSAARRDGGGDHADVRGVRRVVFVIVHVCACGMTDGRAGLLEAESVAAVMTVAVAGKGGGESGERDEKNVSRVGEQRRGKARRVLAAGVIEGRDRARAERGGSIEQGRDGWQMERSVCEAVS